MSPENSTTTRKPCWPRGVGFVAGVRGASTCCSIFSAITAKRLTVLPRQVLTREFTGEERLALRVGTWGFCLSSVLQRSSFSLLGPLVPVCSLCPKRWAMGLVSQHLLRRGMRGGFVGIRRRCLGFKRAACLFQQSNYCGILTEHLTCFGLRGSFEIYSLSFRDASVDQ